MEEWVFILDQGASVITENIFNIPGKGVSLKERYIHCGTREESSPVPLQIYMLNRSRKLFLKESYRAFPCNFGLGFIVSRC